MRTCLRYARRWLRKTGDEFITRYWRQEAPPGLCLRYLPKARATLVDTGGAYADDRNPVEVITPKLSKTARSPGTMVPEPDLETSAHAWILAGGAHHTSFKHGPDQGYMEDLAEMFASSCWSLIKTPTYRISKKS